MCGGTQRGTLSAATGRRVCGAERAPGCEWFPKDVNRGRDDGFIGFGRIYTYGNTKRKQKGALVLHCPCWGFGESGCSCDPQKGKQKENDFLAQPHGGGLTFPPAPFLIKAKGSPPSANYSQQSDRCARDPAIRARGEGGGGAGGGGGRVGLCGPKIWHWGADGCQLWGGETAAGCYKPAAKRLCFNGTAERG